MGEIALSEMMLLELNVLRSHKCTHRSEGKLAWTARIMRVESKGGKREEGGRERPKQTEKGGNVIDENQAEEFDQGCRIVESE